MSLSIDIVPLANSLDMYGEPHSSSAFSLSGHVSITLNSPFSVFERRRAARVILQSVLLTFDGQTEVLTTSLGYSPLRLYSLSRELLASSEPIELSNEEQEETDEPCRWNVVFDLPIPGWLPASQDFSPNDVGASIKYYLHAVVKFVVVEDHRAASWSFSTLCSPFRSRARAIETCKKITLRRFVEPPTDEPTPPESINYLLSPPNKPSDIPTIPSNILSKIQILASVPTYVDVRENSLPFTLRLRTKDLEDADCKRLHVTNFTLDVVQEETCRRAKDASEYQSRYPVPSQDSQPPNKPLCRAHHMGDMYKLSLFLTPAFHTTSLKCSTSLLPAEETGVYRLKGDTRVFANDAVNDTATWYTLETTIPFIHNLPSLEDSSEWEGSSKVRPSSASPLYDVSHSLKLTVRCEYEIPDSTELAIADLTFSLPLQFARVAPPLPPRDILPALFNSMRLVDGAYPPMPSLLPYGANLPVYSQLFDSHGNRKMDATPLPLYTPRTSPDSPVDTPTHVLVPERETTRAARHDCLMLMLILYF
ncbi:hypothetical protein MVEN_02035100 [Mycena venus]|uniref:Uncharacterized protein n=1 Tax=Mycena venus TaxID=2733690 RepID=A0A8H6XCS6_9AGAR|nr:hypothetical protein MVEN_02035100 [Mycena venus]